MSRPLVVRGGSPDQFPHTYQGYWVFHYCYTEWFLNLTNAILSASAGGTKVVDVDTTLYESDFERDPRGYMVRR